MKKIVIFLIIAITSKSFFACDALSANKIDNFSVSKFLEQYQIVMNSGREDALSQFFKFYGAAQSKYIITSYYVDPEKNEALISQEQRELNRDQFIQFIRSALIGVSNYQYIQNIDNINLDKLNDTGTVQFNYTENILINKLEQGNVMGHFYQKVFANCNMNIVVETADINILGLNCIRKIAKKDMGKS